MIFGVPSARRCDVRPQSIDGSAPGGNASAAGARSTGRRLAADLRLRGLRVANVVGEVGELEDFRVAKRDSAPDHVDELADVAGPRIVLQRGHRVRRGAGHLAPAGAALVVAAGL